jgi:hypothetical protein
MRVGAWALPFLLCLAGCGYVGEPLPPALKQPMRVTDLGAVEHGSKIVVRFTVPKITTEALPIKDEPMLELRIGPYTAIPFQQDEWARSADLIPVDPVGKTAASVEIPAAKYYGKTVIISVNAHGPGGRTAGWGNFQVLTVVPALPTPQALETANAADAIHLEWHAAAGEFRVYRKSDTDQNWSQIGTSPKSEYTDRTIEYGKTYQYYVQTVEKTDNGYAESEVSEVKTFKPEDHFAPAIPSGLVAVPGTRSIDLVWERNTEKDFATYKVFRDGRQIAEGQTAPTYSDRDAKPGTKYQYQVSALDTAGNESSKSDIAEAAIP